MQRSIRSLWILAIFLLLLDLALLYGLNLARVAALESLNKVETTLDKLAHEVIVYNIEVNQDVPIKADVPLNQTMEIPLNTVIPIDQKLTVPFQTGAGEIEIDLPLQMDFPVDIIVPVEFNETIKVDTTIQLNTTVPVEIVIARTALADYLENARLDILQLRNRLTLQGEVTTVEEVAAAVDLDNETGVMAGPTAGNEPRSQLAAGEMLTTTRPLPADSPDAEALRPSPTVAAASAFESDNPTPYSDLAWCTHPYWPLRPGTAWTYNSSFTSYVQQVNDVSDDRVFLGSQYEGQPIQFELECHQDGLGGSYPGDMRRITEFGRFVFSNSRGVFLPPPDVMENIGTSWVQEYQVAGTIEGRYGRTPVLGHINQGQAVAFYTPTGFETLQTPLGPREALRIEQQLELDLKLEFDLGGRIVPATESIHLTNVYWFVKGIGLVKMHWQGGVIQQSFLPAGEAMVDQQSPVPALAEEFLVFVCVLSDGNSSECLRVSGITEADLTVPPESELEIPVFIFPEGPLINSGLPAEPEALDEFPDRPTEDIELPPSEQPETDEDDQAALLAYAETVSTLGEEISEAGEAFGRSAVIYRNGEITLAEFRSQFSSFKSKVRGPIQEINGLSPPPEAETIHQKLTGGLEKCDQGINLMDDWFDTGDSGTKEATMLLVVSCIDEVTAAGAELEALVSK